MSSAIVPMLPSPNSAFVRPQSSRKLRTEPSSSLRKRFLFDASSENGNDIKKILCEATRKRQTVFAARWRCDCDVISSCCDKHVHSNSKDFNLPKYDWVPICDVAEETPSLLKRFELSRINMNTIGRPRSPVPFDSPHFKQSFGPPSYCDHTSSAMSNLSSVESPKGCFIFHKSSCHTGRAASSLPYDKAKSGTMPSKTRSHLTQSRKQDWETLTSKQSMKSICCQETFTSLNEKGVSP